jgi:hypothetical protein
MANDDADANVDIEQDNTGGQDRIRRCTTHANPHPSQENNSQKMSSTGRYIAKGVTVVRTSTSMGADVFLQLELAS